MVRRAGVTARRRAEPASSGDESPGRRPPNRPGSLGHHVETASSRRVFLHQEGETVHEAGDLWLVRLQDERREAFIEEQRQIKKRGFLAVMWPQLLVFLALLFLWVWLLRRYL